MEGIVSGHARTYDEFKNHIPPKLRPLFDELRDYCFSLGTNVLEDVRMHRIVFSKSLTFRFFADIEPQRESVMVKIRRDRKEPLKEIEVIEGQDLGQVKSLISEAYSNIH